MFWFTVSANIQQNCRHKSLLPGTRADLGILGSTKVAGYVAYMFSMHVSTVLRIIKRTKCLAITKAIPEENKLRI